MVHVIKTDLRIGKIYYQYRVHDTLTTLFQRITIIHKSSINFSPFIFFFTSPVTSLPKDCSEVQTRGATNNGLYTLQPTDGGRTFQVYCDLETDGGGWTVSKFMYLLDRPILRPVVLQRSEKVKNELKDTSDKKRHIVAVLPKHQKLVHILKPMSNSHCHLVKCLH